MLSLEEIWEFWWHTRFLLRTFSSFLFYLWRNYFVRWFIDNEICPMPQGLNIYLLYSTIARFTSHLGQFTTGFSCSNNLLRKISTTTFIETKKKKKKQCQTFGLLVSKASNVERQIAHQKSKQCKNCVTVKKRIWKGKATNERRITSSLYQ